MILRTRDIILGDNRAELTFSSYFSFRLNTDSEVAKKYGLIANNAYVLPTIDDVIRHRVVITTLAMSQHLLELQLNRGFFTHILVDEAAQALEPEALIPLALAGQNTKVVFTGDHVQVGIEIWVYPVLLCSALFCYALLCFLLFHFFHSVMNFLAYYQYPFSRLLFLICITM